MNTSNPNKFKQGASPLYDHIFNRGKAQGPSQAEVQPVVAPKAPPTPQTPWDASMKKADLLQAAADRGLLLPDKASKVDIVDALTKYGGDQG